MTWPCVCSVKRDSDVAVCSVKRDSDVAVCVFSEA